MSYGRHIHITGPARSGTTLMKNLMHCYLGTFVTLEERHPSLDLPRRINITKYPEDGPELYEEYPGLNVIYMARDPRDMYVSRLGEWRWWHDRVSREPGLFGSKVDDFLALAQDRRTFVVYYEELVSDPDRIQQEIADRFYLQEQHPFSDGHRWFLKERGLGVVRSPSTDSIGAWRRDENIGIVKQWMRSDPGVSRYIQAMGYEGA
ncbi:hypothetical protein LCGC14_0747570 [marine sediment metagenome]|uniref:Sulfotransferase domain-containing protein n=1 Tax=marine sediment metagenome TaxID=412755 RepID=A0A0F9TBZ8_9ZZZZ